MLVTYDEIMAWYEQRRAQGLTIETPTLVEQYKANPATDIPDIPLCDTCRWHISRLWGSEYCAGRPHCYDCPSWMMYRADDYDTGDENENYHRGDYKRKKARLL
jgi:hypothetical protein